MKNILYAIFVSILIGCTGVHVVWAQPASESEIPEWMKTFEKDYDEHGMSTAVENALEDGVTPNEILSFIISYTEKFRTKRGLKALYCAGVDRNTVRDSADKLGITVEDVSVSLEEAIAECGSKITLSDRDLMDEPASSPESGASTMVQNDTQEEIQAEVQEEPQKDVSELITDPTPSSQPSSPFRP